MVVITPLSGFRDVVTNDQVIVQRHFEKEDMVLWDLFI